jgi:hypothetical protein
MNGSEFIKFTKCVLDDKWKKRNKDYSPNTAG